MWRGSSWPMGFKDREVGKSMGLKDHVIRFSHIWIDYEMKVVWHCDQITWWFTLLANHCESQQLSQSLSLCLVLSPYTQISTASQEAIIRKSMKWKSKCRTGNSCGIKLPTTNHVYFSRSNYPENSDGTWKWWLPRGISSSNGSFSGEPAVSFAVLKIGQFPKGKPSPSNHWHVQGLYMFFLGG